MSVLTPQYLCTFKSQGEYRNPTEVIRLRKCSTVKSADQNTGRDNSFRVDTPQCVFYFVADSSSDKASWINNIGQQVLHCSHSRPVDPTVSMVQQRVKDSAQQVQSQVSVSQVHVQESSLVQPHQLTVKCCKHMSQQESLQILLEHLKNRGNTNMSLGKIGEHPDASLRITPIGQFPTLTYVANITEGLSAGSLCLRLAHELRVPVEAVSLLSDGTELGQDTSIRVSRERRTADLAVYVRQDAADWLQRAVNASSKPPTETKLIVKRYSKGAWVMK